MGKTILISSHILTELSDICTSVAILEKGKVVATGPIQQIQKALQPGLAFRLEVVGGGESARAAFDGLPGIGSLAVEGDLVKFSFTSAREEVPELVKALVQRGVRIIGLQEEKTDLESLFMKLTKGEVS